MTDAYALLIAMLDGAGAQYRLIDHPPEGRTELASRLRGHELAQAAKCIVVMVKIGKKVTRYVLAVVPGDLLVDLEALKRVFNGTYVAFASRDVAERLARAETGTILPFPLSSELELVADPAMLGHTEIFFNAGRLDRSIAMMTADYLAMAQPRLARIARTAVFEMEGSN